MTKLSIVTILVLQSFTCFCQPKTDLNKWTRACLNLEVRPNFFASKIWCRLQALQKKGYKLNAERVNELRKRYDEQVITWTGLFLKYRNKHYLITARHCLVDDSSSIKNYVYEKIYLIENGSDKLKKTDHSIDPSSSHAPYLDGYVYGKNVQYEVSDSAIDLGIIALDDIPTFGHQFIQALYQYNYKPINFSDIDTTHKLSNHQEITAIGFPKELSHLSKQTKNIDSAIQYYRASNVSIPDVSTGYIKDPMNNFFDFTGNIFSYHGFSGGPVISHNKLIGINKSYGGLYINTDSRNLNYYTDEFAEFVKAYEILPLLKKLEKRFPLSAAQTEKIKLSRIPISIIISGGNCD